MFQNENNVLQRDCFYLQTNVEMIQIEVDKEAPEPKFFCWDRNGTGIGTKIFYQNRNQHLFY